MPLISIAWLESFTTWLETGEALWVLCVLEFKGCATPAEFTVSSCVNFYISHLE